MVIFFVTFQTDINVIMLSTGGQGDRVKQTCISLTHSAHIYMPYNYNYN